LFLCSFKIYLVKYAIPKFEKSGVKSNDGPGDKNEIMFEKGCDTNEGHCSIEPSNAIFADALVTSLQQRNSREPTKFPSEHLKVRRHQKMKK